MSGPSYPKHIAIIMDGNGRWAQRHSRPRIYGHVKGCGRVREIIREASNQGVKALTLYAFSSENWGRPEDEVRILMQLLHKWLVRQQKELSDRNIRFRAIGKTELLPKEVYAMVKKTEEFSKHHTGLQLTLALSYSSRDEMIEAVRKLATRAAQGEIDPRAISEKDFSEQLYTEAIGDPDLLIRTSGELRVSNFLLWQMAYTEFYFTDTMWPDFKVSDFKKALDAYASRERRFGLTSAQLESSGSKA